MSADKTLLDPWSQLGSGWPQEVESPLRTNGRVDSIVPPGPAEEIGADAVVPPVRTIVLDREPTAVAPAAGARVDPLSRWRRKVRSACAWTT